MTHAQLCQKARDTAQCSPGRQCTAEVAPTGADSALGDPPPGGAPGASCGQPPYPILLSRADARSAQFREHGMKRSALPGSGF